MAVELLDRATALALEIGRPDRAARFSSRVAWTSRTARFPFPRRSNDSGATSTWPATIASRAPWSSSPSGELEATDRCSRPMAPPFRRGEGHHRRPRPLLPLGAAEYPICLGDSELAAGEPARIVDLLRASCSTLDRLGEHSRLASMAPLTAQTLLAVGRLGRGRALRILGAGHRTSDGRRRARAMAECRSPGCARNRVATMRRSPWHGSRWCSWPTPEPSYRERLGHLTLARALRAAGDEPAALAAADRGSAPRVQPSRTRRRCARSRHSSRTTHDARRNERRGPPSGEDRARTTQEPRPTWPM